MNNNQENYTDESVDDELTPEEELEISGYQPEQVALIDQEFLIERDNEQAEAQSGSENPLIRFAIAKRCCKQIASLLVGSVMVSGWMIWSIFFAPKAVVKAPVQKPTSKVFEKGESDEAARLKAELALLNQASRNVEQPVEQSPPPPPKPNKLVRTVRKPRQTKPRIIREKVPSPPRIIRETVPSPPKIIRETVPIKSPVLANNKSASPAPTRTNVEKIDPLERWNQLATLGQQTTSLRNNFTENNPSFEQAQALPNQPESKNENATSESDNITLDSENNSSPILFANASNREQGKDRAISTVPSNKLNINHEVVQTPGELGILNRTPALSSQETITYSNSPIQVQIGTSAKASVLVPIFWSEEDENQERFAIELQEDVLSIDKRIALSKGTILITEINSVSKINKQVHANRCCSRL